MRGLAGLTAAVLCLAQNAGAQDYVASDGALDDDAFYDLVSCAAPPDQPCARSRLFWPPEARTLRVAIVRRDRAYLGGKLKRAEAALERAVQAINTARSGLRLVEQDGPDADIAVHLVDAPARSVLEDPALPHLAGRRIGNAGTYLEVQDGFILHSDIVLTTGLPLYAYESVMLEEVTQALGLITDIRNPWYETRSIFSQDADNTLKALGAQDVTALRRHYPVLD